MRKLIALTLAALTAVPVLAASAALPNTDAVAKTAAFIKTTQQSDGGFGGFDDGQTYDAMIALRAAGIDVSTVSKDGKTAIDFINAKADAADSAPEAAKAALAAYAANLDPADVDGTDLIARIAEIATPGEFATNDFGQAISILGLVCTDNSVPAAAAGVLKATQQDSGAWGYDGFADPDTTALAVQALLAAGVPATDPAIENALDWIRENQAPDGGWGFDPTASNANSTTYVAQALLALGLSPESAEFTKNGVDPIAFILSQQQEDGSFIGFDPAYAANQVLPLLAGRTFCDAPSTPLQSTPETPTATPPTAPTQVPATSTPQPTNTPTSTPTTAPTQAPATNTPANTSTVAATNTPTRTATLAATSTPARTATPTRSPVPPRTGTGTDGDGGGTPAPLLALAGLAILAGSAGLAAARRR